MEITFLTLYIMIMAWENIAACDHYHDPACIVTNPLDGKHFLNQWIVHVKGGEEKARNIAEELGFKYMKEMPTHKNYYFFRHPTDVPHRHKMKHTDVLGKLKSHKDILLSDQQYVFELTLNEIDDFEDMVGHSEPLDVTITHFTPDEMNEYHSEKEPTPVFVHDKKQEQNIETVHANNGTPDVEIKDMKILSDRNRAINFKVMKNKEEKETYERKVQLQVDMIHPGFANLK